MDADLQSGSPAQASASQEPERAPRRLLFHIRHFGVGGIENALLGWLRGLDRKLFSVHLSVALPTRELEDIYRARLPQDVVVHCLIDSDSWLARMHQRRRDHQLGKAGRLVFGTAMAMLGQRRIAAGLEQLTPAYDVIIDYDLTLRKMASAIHQPLMGVRHFRLWSRRTAKAVRTGRAYREYDRLLVLNEAMKSQAQALFADELRRIQTLPNAFDLEAIRRQAKAPAALPLPQGPYVVCVARLDIKTKGLDVLLHAWQALQCAHEAATGHTLVLVGDGPDRGRLQQMVALLGIQDSVRFAGLQTNPYPWIGGARLLVLASRSEGLPNVLIEAMALGCMVLSTDCPVGPRELLDEGRAGVLVPVDDADALMHGMWRALSDVALRQVCLAAADKQVGNYSIEAGNRRMLALVDGLLADRN